MDLLAKVCGKSATERIEEKKKKIDVQAKRDTDVALQENKQEQESSLSNTSLDANRVRSAAGIGEFQHSSSTLTVGQLQLSSRKERRNKMDFEITGYEGEGMQLPKRKHFIYYPRSLRIHTFERGVLADFPPPVKDNIGVPSWWLLDGGSIVPVLALGLQEGDSLLDLCSAPGGKSLLALLTGLTQKVVCNEFKLSRLGQLKRALSTYIPPESKLSDSVILKRKDASDIATWDELNVYDKVCLSYISNLLFVFNVCHVRIYRNALRSVKVGGSVVYSTCTLSSIQNEAVVENAVAIAENKFKIKVVEECLSQLATHLSSSGLFRFSDQCKRGALVLPFLPSNFGPMYICKLSRLQ
uniref:NOL1/NOP2/Sun domain family member 4 n=1 Tax=Heterorhabditis bacteriophora TaxID=37862 RepID=A0A1I7XTQ5_HETBA